MKRGNPDLFRTETDDLIHTLPHLPRRLIGKGDGHDMIGIHPLLIDQISRPVGKHPRLTGSGPRQDQDRTFCLHDRLLLPLV